jgi:hypothetical protein
MTPILHPPYSHTYDGVTSFPILHMALREWNLITPWFKKNRGTH